MDAIEYSVKLASQIAVNGQIKEAYDLYLANLGKLIVRLKTVVDIAEDGSSKNADEALFRMIPLCRVCVNKIEDILQAGAISSAFLSRGPHGVPPPLSKSPGRLTSSFLGTVMPSSSSHSLSAASHDTSLFSAVLDGFPVDDFNPPPHLGNEVSKGDSFVSYEAPESQSESTRSSVDDSMLDSLKERVENHTQRFKTLEPESSDGHFTMEPSTSKATKAPPEIPSSPLNTLYMTLSQKLIMRINSPTSPNQYSEPQQSVDAEEEESNQIRTQIGRILNQIQIASVSNAGINMFCFRPIAIAYQLCVIEHTLFRNIHSNDILIHKPPHSPAPSFQGISDFFNYLTRLIECTILQQVGVTERVKTILKWIKVAVNLKRFNNFQTLKGVTSALSTPPIIRLKKTWTMLRRKYTNESADLEELTSLVSEQSNFNKYRSFIKDNQTRPMVPFLGVLLHDVTYLTAAGKKEGASDISSDKRIQEILKFIRYCSLGPRYSYEMLIEMDTMHSSSSFVAPSKKSPLTVKRKVKGGGLSEYGMEALGSIFKDSNEEEIGIFMSHWLLSRKWVSEREVDDLSKEREPKASNTVAAAPKHHATVLVGNASEASTEDPENNSLTRQSKTDDNDACQIRNVSGSEHSTLRAGKDSVANSQSPSLSRSRATQASNSFISVIESAFMKGSKPQGAASAASGTGASTPSNAALNSSGKRVAAGGATSSKEFRGRPLNRLLNRRQKSLSNLNTDEFPSSICQYGRS
ncbi:ras guanine nucleotide exchange factor domain-containing protein [Chytriomyces sp. MP71]|nr:ras guanine nucleotide exchange factor domain-containing protein [Chytriomyces sp. MP71]